MSRYGDAAKSFGQKSEKESNFDKFFPCLFERISAHDFRARIFLEADMAEERILMDAAAIGRTLTRLSHEVVEKNKGTDGLCLLGVKRRGEIVAKRVCALIKKSYGEEIPCAGIDIGMYRDDLVSGYFVPDAEANRPGFAIDGKKVVLCDDVLHTGRTVRAAIEAIFDLGRPASVRLLVLVDRGGRQMPVCADLVGKNIPTSSSEFIDVRFEEIEGEDSLGIRRAE